MIQMVFAVQLKDIESGFVMLHRLLNTENCKSQYNNFVDIHLKVFFSFHSVNLIPNYSRKTVKSKAENTPNNKLKFGRKLAYGFQ